MSSRQRRRVARHFGMARVGRSWHSLLRTQWGLPAPYVHTQHAPTKPGQVFLGPLMRFGFIFSGPLHLVSPSRVFRAHILFFFLSISFLSSCLVIPSLSLFCANIGPALSLHVHSYTKPRSEVAQVFLMRYGSFGCSCSLGSFSSQPHTLSCLVFLSPLHLFVFCARALAP